MKNNKSLNYKNYTFSDEVKIKLLRKAFAEEIAIGRFARKNNIQDVKNIKFNYLRKIKIGSIFTHYIEVLYNDIRDVVEVETR